MIAADFNLLKTDYVAALTKAIQEADCPGAVIVIDTLNRATPGADENSSEDMGLAIEGAKVLQKKVGGLVMLIHHTGKDTTRGMRGHSSLFAALDSAIEVVRTGDQRSWKVAKSKDGEDGKEVPFELEVIHLGIEIDGDDMSSITSCVINEVVGENLKSKHLTPQQRQGMDSLVAACREYGNEDADGIWGVDVEDWRGVFYKSSTADTVEAKKKAFQRIRNLLVNEGLSTVENDRYRPTDIGAQGSIAFSLKGRDTGTKRDIGGTCPDDQTEQRDGTGHTTISVSHVPLGGADADVKSLAKEEISRGAAPPGPESPPVKFPEISDVGAKARAKGRETPEKYAAVEELLKKYGGGKVAGIPPESRAEFLAEVEAV